MRSGLREFPAAEGRTDRPDTEVWDSGMDSRDRASPAEIQSLRVDSCHAPALALQSKRLHHSVNHLGVRIHRRKSFGLLASKGTVWCHQKVTRLHPLDPPEAGDQVRARDRDSVQMEIGEPRIELCRGVPREEAGLEPRIL